MDGGEKFFGPGRRLRQIASLRTILGHWLSPSTTTLGSERQELPHATVAARSLYLDEIRGYRGVPGTVRVTSADTLAFSATK